MKNTSHVLYKNLIQRCENCHHFIEKKTQMDKSLHQDVGSLIIREKQIKLTMRCHFTGIQLAKIFKSGNAKYLRIRSGGNAHPRASGGGWRGGWR